MIEILRNMDGKVQLFFQGSLDTLTFGDTDDALEFIEKLSDVVSRDSDYEEII